jgi:hypothetical protein
MKHFPVKINADKIIGLQQSVVEEYGIKENDIFEVETIAGRELFREVVLITKIDRSNRSSADEFRFTHRLSDVPTSTEARVKIIGKIEQLSSESEKTNYEKFYLPSIFPDAILGKVDANKMIIFLGNHVPIFTPIRINLHKFIHYFGCFYADGTKKGPGWRNSASTPEQAVYYLEKYNQLIVGAKLDYRLVYTKKPSDIRIGSDIRNDLLSYWKKNARVEIKNSRIYIRVAKSDEIRKWNEHGSLAIQDNRTLILHLHMRLMEKILSYLRNTISTEAMWDFLFGILEGDGSVAGGQSRFGIGFACHKDDEMIRQLLDILQVKYSLDSSRVKRKEGSGIYVYFWLFEVLLNLEILSDNLFVFYPKRRKIFIERLLKQPTVRYLMGKKSKISSYARSEVLAYQLDNELVIKLLNGLQKELQQIQI